MATDQFDEMLRMSAKWPVDAYALLRELPAGSVSGWATVNGQP